MKYIFLDVETDGLINEELNHYPNIVSLSYIVTDANLKTELKYYEIFEPAQKEEFFDNYLNDLIPASGIDAVSVHGITRVMQEQHGVNKMEALNKLIDLLNTFKNYTFVAHNIEFDYKVLLANISDVIGKNKAFEFGFNSFFKPKHCTMKLSLKHVKKIKKGVYSFPSLKETYRHFFNEELINHHNALADAKACKRIYKHLIKLKNENL